VTLKHVYEIAKIKCTDADLAAVGEKNICKQIIGSAKTLGLEVVL
jgi:large subunit ribosomal protein L11